MNVRLPWLRRLLLAFVGCSLLLSLGTAAVSAAERLGAASDNERLWILVQQIDARQFTLYERLRNDPPEVARPFGSVKGQYNGAVRTHGVAAGDGWLWLVFEDNTVQSFRLTDDPVVGPRAEMKRNAQLPEGTDVRSLQAGRTLWALVRVDNPMTLERIDATGSPATDAPAGNSGDGGSDAVEPTSPPRFPVDRLVRLEGDRWVRRALPDDWMAEGRNFIVLRHARDDAPWLISAVRTGGRDELWVYEPTADGWRKRVHDAPHAGLMQPIVVEGQIVIPRRRPTSGRVEIELLVLRPQAQARIGVLGMEAVDGSSSALVGWGQTAALIVRDPEGATRWMQMDLTGQVVLEPTPLVEARTPMVEQVMNWVLALLLPLALILVMLLFWRRDPEQNKVALPEGVRVAEVTRRLLAAGIDILPGIVVASYVHDVTMGQIVQFWPLLGSSPGEFTRIYPALTTIGIFVLVTLPFELFTARTPGKMVFGIVVTDLRGQPPRMWSVVLRNLFKAADLLFTPLLLIPLFGPFRQRLGDLVASTVVIISPSEAKPLEEDEKDEDE